MIDLAVVKTRATKAKKARRRRGLIPIKPAHTPQRTCLGCRQVRPKSELMRLVKTSGVVKVDLTGSKPGRGAYICKSKDCLDKMLKEGRLARSFKGQIAIKDCEELTEYASRL